MIKIFSLAIALAMFCNGYTQQNFTTTSVRIDRAKNKAVVKGKSAPGVDVSLRYAGERGAELFSTKTGKKGAFQFSVDLIRDYAQQLIAVELIVKGSDTIKIENSIDLIPAGEKLALSADHVRQLLTAHRWKSVETDSRVIIRQTAPKPAFDKLLTYAQKYFRFNADGSFDFEITHPKQFSYTGGTWTIDDNNTLTITTDYPHGVLEIKNIRINELNTSTLSLLEEVSDGLFITGFVKE